MANQIYPAQFSGKWLACIVILLVLQVCYLIVRRKALSQDLDRGFLTLQSTIAIFLAQMSFFIAEYGKSYQVLYEAEPEPWLLEQLSRGAFPWLVVGLAGAVCLLCAWIGCAPWRERKMRPRG